MSGRFPRREADGSFEVIAAFAGVVADEAATRAWIEAWTEGHGTWRRAWSSGNGEAEQVLVLGDEFSEAPSFESLQGSELKVRFRGRPTAKFWRDWLVRFTQDFVRDHPGTRLLHYES